MSCILKKLPKALSNRDIEPINKLVNVKIISSQKILYIFVNILIWEAKKQNEKEVHTSKIWKQGKSF